MDFDQVPVPILTPLRRVWSVVALLLIVPVAFTGAGCRSKKKKKAHGVREKLDGDEGGGSKKKGNPILVQSSGSSFKVADPQGLPLIDAVMERMEGEVQGGQGLKSPVQMHTVKARLYEKGKPSMDLTSPEAVWDGEQLVTNNTAHAVTVDGKSIIDSQKAIWISKTGDLALETAKIQGMKDGKLSFTATGPKATVVKKLVTMPEGGVGNNPEGQQMTADHVKWHLDTSKLEGDGHVVVTDTGVRVTGDHLRGDTKLSTGKVTGHTRTELKSARHLPGGKKKGKAEPAAPAAAAGRKSP